jgi:hypothetical protein
MASNKVAPLVGFRDKHGVLEASFADGVSLNLHAASGMRRWYALRPFYPDGNGSVSHPAARKYQHVAFEAFFSGVPHRTHVDRDGDLVAELAQDARSINCG